MALRGGYLHTNSAYMSYAPNLLARDKDITDTFTARVNAQIKQLKDQEQQLYTKFGCNDIKSFIALIKGLFEGSFQTDLQVLKNYSSDRLKKSLQQFKKNTVMLDGKTVRLTLATNKSTQQIDNILKGISGSNGDFSWTIDGQVVFDITWNIPEIKKVINQLQGTHFVHSSNTGRDSAATTVIQYIKNNSNLINVQTGIGNNQLQTYEFRTGPFQYTMDELRAMDLKRDSKALSDISLTIKNFIFNDLSVGASPLMKQAIEEVWNQKMGSNLLNISFFTGGEGWTNHVIGALGEFQTAIFFQYIAHRLPHLNLGNQITKIIADEKNYYGQQLHTDIQFMQSLGIQVKNYNSAFSRINEERTVTVSLHPTEVGAIANDEEVVDYIINSFFNTDIDPIPENIYTQFFRNHAYEMLNLNMNPQIPDQVTFYMIGGNFIPGSEILKAAFIDLSIVVSDTSISGQKGNSTQGYHKGENPEFLDWWHGTQYTGWFPMPQNSIYSWDGKVSIRTKFTYSALFDGDYKLF